MLAWVAFWLNTVLFPCCEAFAAAFDDHADDVSQSVSTAPQDHHAGAKTSERPHHSPGTPCDRAFNAEPTLGGEYAWLPTDRAHQEWVAISVTSVVGPPAVAQAAILALRDYHPPPRLATVRLYLRTQRLLI